MSNLATSHKQTVGGVTGHLLRRFIHVAMILFPIVYYLWGDAIAAMLHMLAWQLVLVLLGIVVILELVRLKTGFVVFAQRQHEIHHISSFAWGTIAMAVVLICVPDPIYAIPIVAGCAIGDPVLGELRAHYSFLTAALVGAMVIAVVWWLCGIWMVIAWWWPFILGPATVIVEWPNLKWIDDNALMMLVPLVLVWVLMISN